MKIKKSHLIKLIKEQDTNPYFSKENSDKMEKRIAENNKWEKDLKNNVTQFLKKTLKDNIKGSMNPVDEKFLIEDILWLIIEAKISGYNNNTHKKVKDSFWKIFY